MLYIHCRNFGRSRLLALLVICRMIVEWLKRIVQSEAKVENVLRRMRQRSSRCDLFLLSF